MDDAARPVRWFGVTELATPQFPVLLLLLPAVLLTLELGVRRWLRSFSSRRHLARLFENHT